MSFKAARVFIAIALLLTPSTVLLAEPAPGGPPAEAKPVPPPSGAAVEPGPGSGAGRAVMAACRNDIETYCAGVERGGGRKIQCLKDNESRLGADCKGAIGGLLAAAGERASRPGAKLRAACAGDVASLCAGIAKGDGRIGRCLKDNEAKLSPACQGARAEIRAKAKELRQAVKQACAAEAQSLCGSATRPREAMACLKERQAQASPGCQAALDKLPARRGNHHGAGQGADGAKGVHKTSAPMEAADDDGIGGEE